MSVLAIFEILSSDGVEHPGKTINNGRIIASIKLGVPWKLLGFKRTTFNSSPFLSKMLHGCYPAQAYFPDYRFSVVTAILMQRNRNVNVSRHLPGIGFGM